MPIPVALQAKTELARRLRELTHNDENSTPVFEEVFEYPQQSFPENNTFALLELTNDLLWIRFTCYVVLEDVALSEKQILILRDTLQYIFLCDPYFEKTRGGNHINYFHIEGKFYRILIYFFPVEPQI